MEIERSLGYTLHRLSFVMDRQSDVILQNKYGIGFSQFKILMVLAEHDGILQRDIANYLGQTEASISRQIRVLVSQGLVHSRQDVNNRRQHITHLTLNGSKIAAMSANILDNHFRPAFNRLTENEQANLHRLLDKLYSCLT